MFATSNTPITLSEYLDFERHSEIKHEYHAGQVLAMAGASARHNLIVSSINAALYRLIQPQGCLVYPSDMKIYLPAGERIVYPDVGVVCGEPDYLDDREDVLLNPWLIVEVLSKSTQAYDRGEKFRQYRALTSLQEYLLVAQDQPHVERYARQADGNWFGTSLQGLDAVLSLNSIQGDLALSQMYEQIRFT